MGPGWEDAGRGEGGVGQGWEGGGEYVLARLPA